MAPYLTREEFATRMGVSIDEAPSVSDLLCASDALDASGPFTGERYDEDQARAFPRTYLYGTDAAGVVPDAVLEAVCLLAKAEQEDEDLAAVRSYSVLDKSVVFATPVAPRSARKVAYLMRPYLLTSGRLR